MLPNMVHFTLKSTDGSGIVSSFLVQALLTTINILNNRKHLEKLLVFIFLVILNVQ